MPSIHPFALIIAATFLTTVTGFAQPDWTGWLGPNRNGKVEGFKTPETWPATLSKKWEVKVGTGYATPLKVGQRIFQHARMNDEEVVICIDLETGKTIWSQSAPTPFKIGGGGESHGKGPKSNAVISDGRIFTLSINGVVRGWDTQTGKRLWERDYRSRFKVNQPYWGVSTSPVVDGNQLIVHLGNVERGALVALDVATGREVWSQGNHGPCYSSPQVVTIHGKRQILEWNHNTLAGVESQTGRLLWEHPLPHLGNNQNMPTPTLHNDLILVGGENRGTRCIKVTLTKGKWETKEVWHERSLPLDMSSAVMHGDHLYGFTHFGRGKLFCLNAKTGKIQWQSPARTGNNATFLTTDDHVITLIDDGELRILSTAANDYEVIAKYQVAESPTWAAPVLLQQGLLIKAHDTLTFWTFN